MNVSWKGLAALAVLIIVGLVLVATQLAVNWAPQRGRLPQANPAAASPASQAQQTEPSAPSASPTPNAQATLAALEMKVRDNPTDVEALTELGGLYFQFRLYPRAADAFASALELDPENARLRTDFGSSLLYQGMLSLAKREYLRAIALDPALPDPHFNMAVILSHSEQPDIPQALSEWQEVIRLAPDSGLARTAQEYIKNYAPEEAVAEQTASP